MGKWIVSIFGVLVSLGFVAAVATMNYMYGQSLGRDPVEQQLYAGVHGLIDISKILLPFFVFMAWNNRRYIAAGLSAIALAGCISYSIAGIGGFYDLSRATTTGNLNDKKTTAAGLNRQLARLEEEREALGVVGQAAVLQKELEAKQQDRRWSSTKGCDNATRRSSRRFCTSYLQLEGELAKAERSVEIDRKIEQMRTRVSSFSGYAEIDRGDPRAAIISRLVGWELLSVQTWLGVLFVGLLEFMATFGIFISLNHGELGRRNEKSAASVEATVPAPAAAVPEPAGVTKLKDVTTATAVAKPKKAPQKFIASEERGEVADFAHSCLEPDRQGEALIADLYDPYHQWCGTEGVKPYTKGEFCKRFEVMMSEAGFPLEEGCVSFVTLKAA